MPDKKLTDAEIVKALECCRYDDYDYCEECPYLKNKPCQENLIQDTFDLINRQKAEIERLKNELDILSQKRFNIFERVEYVGRIKAETKAEAYKECIEKVKEQSNKMELVCSGALVRIDYTITEEELDDLLKELVGEK